MGCQSCCLAHIKLMLLHASLKTLSCPHIMLHRTKVIVPVCAWLRPVHAEHALWPCRGSSANQLCPVSAAAAAAAAVALARSSQYAHSTDAQQSTTCGTAFCLRPPCPEQPGPLLHAAPAAAHRSCWADPTSCSWAGGPGCLSVNAPGL